ncbi:MAG: PAS domain S-box protein [Bacteroidia bacterium]|nr:MAG: PAS domain S-box protein [Bacteroidia bacterium]
MSAEPGQRKDKKASQIEDQIDEAVLISDARKVSAMIIARAPEMQVDELISTMLRESVRLTQSKLGFFGTFEPLSVSLSGISWFGTGDFEKIVNNLPNSIGLKNNKIWLEYISLKEPVIINSYNHTLFPHGHVPLQRYMFVPIIKENELTYVIGLADKEDNYKTSDNNIVSLIWDTALTEISRKTIEQTLIRSEESLALAVKETGLGVWDYNAAERKMVIVKGFSNFISETSSGNIIPTDEWLNLVHPDERADMSEKFRAHLVGETEEYRNEYRVINKEGNYKWIQIIGRAVERDGNRIAKRIVGVIIDIDYTKRLTQEVEESKNWLQTIIDSIDSLLYVKDMDGRYIFINKAFTEAFGYNPEQAIGKTTAELSLKSNRISVEADRYVQKKGLSRTFEQNLMHRDGEERRYLTSKIPIFDSGGKVYAIVVLAINITRLKALENQLRDNMLRLDAAITGTGNGLWDWDFKNDLLVLNDNWFEMLGYTRQQIEEKYTTIRYNTFADLVHPDDLKRVEEKLQQHFSGELEYYRIEIRLRTAGGGWKWVLAAGKVFERSDDGTPVRMVGIHTDIDYRIKMEEQLNQAKNRAEESDRLKSSFLANMSHEIRTPMNGIIGFLDLLESSDLTPEQRNNYMSIVRKSSNQLLNIVNDIIDISKIEADQVTINESVVDLSALMDEMLVNYTSILAGSRVSISTRCMIGFSNTKILTDSSKVTQVLSNLVSNAIKFTSEGKITIVCEEKNGFIEFCVEDTGSGIEPSFIDAIFERFRQAEIGYSRKQEGTGLGLAISKAYVEKMGGRIWVESVQGKGSRFFFNIPARFIIKNEVAEAIPPLKTGGKDVWVLVVEDELYNFMLVDRLLKSQGFNVIRAEDGDSAISMVESGTGISIVLMDIRLPGMDGYEATRRIKSINPGIPVIALTALALSGDREKAIEAGCDDYLRKPILKELLFKIMEKYTG